MKKNNSYHIQIPEKIMAILPTWEESSPFKGFDINSLRLILSRIATHQRKDDRGNIYAQLKMEYLRNIIWDADKYIFLLIGAGIIERIGGYIPNKESYKYRFTPAYQSKYVPTELNDPKLLKRIREVNTNQGRRESRFYPKQKQQLKTLTINYDNAVILAKKAFPDDIVRYNFAIGQAARILNHEPYFIRDDSGHRVHTPLTNLTKILRSEIQIAGKYLSGLDIGNSQLYFAIKSLLDPESVKDFFPGKFPLMMLKSLRLSEQQDVATFVSLVSKAQLYKFLEAEFLKVGLNIPVIDPLKVSGVCKKIIFTILYEENRLTSKAKKIFQKHFPNVDKAFSVLRMANYTDFVNCLTRLESFAINDLIIARLNNEHPCMVAQQIYDNVVTEAPDDIKTSIATDNIETVWQVMTEELLKFTGHAPVLRVENFRPQPLKLTKNYTMKAGRSRGRERVREQGVPYDVENLVTN